LNQWDTYQWKFPHGEHPCVIISPQARASNPAIETVNILGCSTQRAARAAREHEIMLDKADGMDWETLARCDVIFLAPKKELMKHRGSVSVERRRALGAKIIRLFGFWVG